MSLTTITVTGSYPAGAGSGVATGFVTFVPTARIVNAAGHTIIPQLPVQVQLQLGAFSLPNVITTDNAGLSPAGWAWEVTEYISGVAADPYYVFIPSTFGETVDLSQLTEATPGPIVTAYANLGASNTFTLGNTFAAGITVEGAFELDGTGIASPPGGTTEFLRADGTWDVPAGGGGGGVTPPAGDLGGTAGDPTVVSTHLASPLPTAQGGTGAASLAAAGLVQGANNLSDLASASSARTNLGLGTAATQSAAAFDAAGAAATAQATAESFATSAVGAETTRAEAAEALLAPLASPALTGSPTAPTKTALTNSTDIATTAYTDAAVAVETTRAEAAEALKAPLASPALTGSPTAPTQTTGDNSTKLATDAFVTTAVATETTRAETAEAALLPLTGGTMTGAIAMGAHKVTGLTNGSAPTDAAAYGQIPTSAGSIGGLLAANNLSDVASAGTARTNLGLGSAAVLAGSAVAQTANNLADLANEATARTNLGLGGAAVLAASAVAQTANNLSDLASATAARTNLGLGAAATASLPLPLASGGTGLNAAPGAVSESLLATSTSAVAWSTQTYNIVAYGADPTGAADSTTAINSAIAAAVAAGGTVLIPPGTFSTTGIVISGASKFCIRADRGATLWIAAPTNAAPTQVTRNILTLVGCTDFAIENLTIDGRRDAIAPLTVLAANAASGQALVHVANGAAAAYKVGQVLNVCGGWTVASGAQQNQQDQNLTIASITPGTSGGNDTITFTANLANAYTSATGTQTDGYGPIAGNGGYITPWQTGTATIAGRVLTQEDQQCGIHLIACTRFRVSGCEITGMWESGIRCGDHLLNGSAQNDGATLGTITGNIITHCYDQGIGLWCSANMTVTGNTVTAAGWAGICMTGSDQCTITGNVSTNNTQLIPNGPGGYGAAIEGGLGNVVSANQFNGNAYCPILLTALGTIPFGGPAQVATTVASGSNTVALPATAVNLASATGLATAGQVTILSSAGAQQITYTGVSGNQLTGCTGGVGTMYTGQRVTQYPVFTNNGATLAVGSTTTIVSNGALFQVGGKYSIVDGPRTERITVTAISTNTLTLQYPTSFQHIDQCQIGQAVAESNQILGNFCSGGTDAGIKLASAIRTTIDDNSLYQIGLRGIDGIIWSSGGLQPPYGTIVSNNTITAPDTTGNGAAYSSIAFAQMSDLQISGNRCGGALNATQESYVALFIQAVTDSVVSRNIVADTYGVGMRLDVVNEWPCKRVRVADNQILRTGGEGLVLYGGQELQVAGNVIEGCAPNSGGGYGGALDVRGVQSSIIANNLVIDNGHGGISLDSATINGATVYTSANTFSGNIAGDDGLNYDCWTGAHQQQGSGIKEVSSGQGPNAYDGNIVFGTGANFSLTSLGNTFTGTSLVPVAVKTANYTANPSEFVPCDTTTAALTVTLPTAPTDRTVAGVKAVTLGAGHNVTVACGGTDVFNKTGGGTTATISLPGQAQFYQYSASLGVWYIVGDDLPLTQLDTRYVLDSTMTTLGDTLYGGAAGTATRVPGNTTATKNFYTQTGTGSASAAPAWGAIAAADIPTLNQNTTGTAGGLSTTLAIGSGGTGQTTQQAAINALTGTQNASTYLRSNGTNASLSAIQASDIPTLNQSTTGTAAGLSTTLAVGSGGTGQTTQQAAINALTGTQSAGTYLRSNGTNAALAAIQAADVPTLNQSTTGNAASVGGITVTGTPATGQALVATSATAADWQAAGAVTALTQFGTASANGSTGQYSDAGHVHGAPDSYTWDSPKQHGFKEWLFPLLTSYLNQSFTSGTIYGATFIAQTNSTISKVAVDVTSAAATPTAGENLIGFYTVSGTTWTQATVTGDLSTWGSTGLNEYTFGASQTLVPGTTYMLLMLSVATTAVHLGGFTGNNNFTNLGCSATAAPWMRFFTYGTSQTALPASFTASTSTLSITSAIFPWAGLL
jgi:parallel beta-helix repeat protein